MATDLVQADFSGAIAGIDLAAFSPQLGANFARVAGPPNGIVSTAAGRFRASTPDSDARYRCPTAPPSADYSVRVEATFASVTNGDVVGPTIRCSGDSDTEYGWLWTKLDAATLYGLCLYKFVAGSASQVGSTVGILSGASVVPSAGASAILQISGVGTTLKGYFNGALAITATDPDIAGIGSGGLYLRSSVAADNAGPQVSAFYVNADPAYVRANSGPATMPLPALAGVRQLRRLGFGPAA